MAVELTVGSIEKLCNGSHVQKPIVQLLGYEAVKLKSDSRTNYRLVLSDGVHMNSYFYLSSRLNDLILQKQVEHGTMLRINNYSFTAGENCTDHSPRWIVLIEEVKVLFHRQTLGDPQPLINIVKKKKPLLNLNLNSCMSREFYSIEQLEKCLISVEDLKNHSNGKLNFALKLFVIKKHAINTYSKCRVLNVNTEDSTGKVRVSAFNSLSDKFNEIFQENKTYYVIDTVLKHAISYELKLQPYSVIIECNDEIIQNLESINVSNFSSLLNKSPNTFCDLIGVCIEVGDVEVFGNSHSQTEMAKREIELIDMSMTTIRLKVWGENVCLFDKKFDEPPVVMVKPAVLKEFNGTKHFSMIKTSELLLDPSTDEAHQLKEWYKELITMDDI